MHCGHMTFYEKTSDKSLSFRKEHLRLLNWLLQVHKQAVYIWSVRSFEYECTVQYEKNVE